MIRFAYPVAAVLALTLSSGAFAADYEIDAGHSSIGFKIRHLVAKVPGTFKRFEGTFSFDKAKPEASKVETTIQTASIDTGNIKRDDHLTGPDFFDVKKYPKITFKSTKYEGDDEDGKIHGDLTMHGITKPVVLEAEFTGLATDPWGNKKIGFTAKGKIDRKDFGIIWNKKIDAGGLMLSDEVDLIIEIEGTEKAEKKKVATK